jgi:hypothetical protein
VTQLAMIGYVSPLQPIVLSWALVTGTLALRSRAAGSAATRCSSPRPGR